MSTSEEGRSIKEMFDDVRFNPKEFKRLMKERGFKPKNNARNKPCPCGSGVKFKKCCWKRF